MFFHQIRMEAIVTGGHRRMRGENNLPGDSTNRLIKAEPFILHAVPDRFEYGKSTVPFIQVKDARSYSQCSESAEASDAEQEFLANSNPSIAAVKPGCQVS